MSGGRAHSGSNEPAVVRSPFSERVVEKLDSFRGLFRASIDGSQVQLLARPNQQKGARRTLPFR